MENKYNNLQVKKHLCLNYKQIDIFCPYLFTLQSLGNFMFIYKVHYTFSTLGSEGWTNSFINYLCERTDKDFFVCVQILHPHLITHLNTEQDDQLIICIVLQISNGLTSSWYLFVYFKSCRLFLDVWKWCCSSKGFRGSALLTDFVLFWSPTKDVYQHFVFKILKWILAFLTHMFVKELPLFVDLCVIWWLKST